MQLRPAILTVLLLSIVLLGCSAATPPPAAAESPVRDGALIHISSGSAAPHRALMGLSMAATMSESRDVLVYCDIQAIDLVLKDSQVVVMEPFRSSDEILAKLLEKGVTVMACPSCLAKAGKTEADLKPGIRLAEADAFFNFTKGRIVTLDY